MTITKDQALTLDVFHDDATPVPNRKGRCYEWRRNGATLVWKTRPDDFRVPVKFGLRECATLRPRSPVHAPDSPECPMTRHLTHSEADRLPPLGG